jgi:anti-sigma B factor antagonist
LVKNSLDVRTRRAQDALVIDVKGPVDLFSSPQMRLAILEAIGSQQASRVAINMSEVSYIDSSGVSSLVEGLQLARARKCHLVLFGLQRGAKEVFELARLDKVFAIRATELEALAD